MVMSKLMAYGRSSHGRDVLLRHLKFQRGRVEWGCHILHIVKLSLHPMNMGISSPPPHRLPIIIKRNSTGTKQYSQAHIKHERLNKSTLFTPRGDKLAESIAPEVLIDRDGDK